MVIPMSVFYIFFIVLGAALTIYLILLLRQALLFMRQLNTLLANNKDNISNTINDFPAISKNVSDITDNAKDITNVATEITADILDVKSAVTSNFNNTLDVIKAVKKFFQK